MSTSGQMQEKQFTVKLYAVTCEGDTKQINMTILW